MMNINLMGVKCHTSISLVFLATAILLLADQATARGRGHDLCQRTDYPPLCRSVVKGTNDATRATATAINALILQTRRAKSLASKRGRDATYKVCGENYSDAIFNLVKSLKNLKTHDKGSLNSNLSAALSDYGTCDDAFAEAGVRSPLGSANTNLRHMASNCLALASLIR